jgi:hypothetical protein
LIFSFSNFRNRKRFEVQVPDVFLVPAGVGIDAVTHTWVGRKEGRRGDEERGGEVMKQGMGEEVMKKRTVERK